MARIVRRTATEPSAFVIDGKEQWLCKCGLSNDEAGERHEAAEAFPDIRSF